MDNNKLPPLEPENSQPEVLPVVPEQMEPLEDLPVIQELSFVQEPPAISEESEITADHPEEPAMADMGAEAPEAEDIPFAAPELPAAEAFPTKEVFPEEPDPLLPVEAESHTVTAEAFLFTEPPVPEEILPDHQAMDQHGLTAHGEEPAPLQEDFPEFPAPKVPLPVIEEVTADQEYRDDGQDFEELMKGAAATQKKAPAPEPVILPKGRPKRKKGEGLLGIPSILATFVWLALIVIIGVTAGRMLWICAADVLAFGREDKRVTITVYEADTMEDIIDKLYDAGLIRYKSLFTLYADISDAEEDIKPGIYDLNTRYDYHALVNFMSPRSSREVITLTIPEGYTCRQIFALLEENRICTAQDIAAYAADGELNDYWFLEGVERGTETCLEGYLFPDTYEFYKNSTPREALQRMLNNFEIKFDVEMRAQLDALNADLTGDYTVREITIVASLIEKESAAPSESPKVAGVIYNRLFNWGSNPAYLNIDASIVYALDGKADLTREDLQMDHPYNTYTNIGLTPGPISNPGLSSLKAALNPESHNYYYYVLNPATGMHQFSTTNEEHNAYVRQFAEAE